VNVCSSVRFEKVLKNVCLFAFSNASCLPEMDAPILLTQLAAQILCLQPHESLDKYASALGVHGCKLKATDSVRIMNIHDW